MSSRYTYNDHLESKRLYSRFLTTDDIIIWTDFFKNKEAVEFLPSFGMDTIEERAKYWIDKQLTRYKENKFGLQALIDKNTNDIIGQCGLIKQEVDGQIEIEVVYHVFKKFWGQMQGITGSPMANCKDYSERKVRKDMITGSTWSWA